MKALELKPCPFCGGNGKIVYIDSCWFVRCEDCFARSEGWSSRNASEDELYYAIQEAVEAAVNAWNRRTNNDERTA